MAALGSRTTRQWPRLFTSAGGAPARSTLQSARGANAAGGEELGKVLAGDPGTAPVLQNPLQRGMAGAHRARVAEPVTRSLSVGAHTRSRRGSGLPEWAEGCRAGAMGLWCQRSPAEASPSLLLKLSGKT